MIFLDWLGQTTRSRTYSFHSLEMNTTLLILLRWKNVYSWPDYQLGKPRVPRDWDDPSRDAPWTWLVFLKLQCLTTFPGAVHEMMRPDRDSFLEIVFKNIIPGLQKEGQCDSQYT